jgi:hypothetical protein
MGHDEIRQHRRVHDTVWFVFPHNIQKLSTICAAFVPILGFLNPIYPPYYTLDELVYEPDQLKAESLSQGN